MFKAPRFWYNQKNTPQKILKYTLSPLGWIYERAVEKRFEMNTQVPMSKPVICVGNLTVGGNGKTPTVLSLASFFAKRNYNPHLLTKGYGGEEAGPVQINRDIDTAEYIGDEALLLAQRAPTWVAANRPLGAQHAIDAGAEMIIMDDGFQNPIIYKDFSLVVIDGKIGFGNQYVMPAGPLRENIENGILRADAVLIIGEDRNHVETLIKSIKDIPVFKAKLVATHNNPKVKGKKFAAFAGIGRPSKFKDTLEEYGAEITTWKEFPDHYLYKTEDLRGLLKTAAKAKTPIITTSKDFVRIPKHMQKDIQVFAVELEWENQDEILDLIEHAINKEET